MALYEYGFQTYGLQELCAEGQLVASLPVSGSLVRFVGIGPVSSLTYPLCAGEKVETVITLPNRVAAPVKKGEIAGRIEFFLDGTAIGHTYLVYRDSVESNLIARRTLRERFLDWLRGNDMTVMGRVNLRQERLG
jgi:D-alanyl-D-alanine carboxypeptidase